MASRLEATASRLEAIASVSLTFQDTEMTKSEESFEAPGHSLTVHRREWVLLGTRSGVDRSLLPDGSPRYHVQALEQLSASFGMAPSLLFREECLLGTPIPSPEEKDSRPIYSTTYSRYPGIPRLSKEWYEGSPDFGTSFRPNVFQLTVDSTSNLGDAQDKTLASNTGTRELVLSATDGKQTRLMCQDFKGWRYLGELINKVGTPFSPQHCSVPDMCA